MIGITLASVTYTIHEPDNHATTTSTSVLFNTTPTSTDNATLPTYFYHTIPGNDSNYVLNQAFTVSNNLSIRKLRHLGRWDNRDSERRPLD